ncbi:MAG: ATP-binding cassette domain-containing protein [Methanophagales archaeon ANME-1-THS]|nr:MAG: ATP-binding cassette domain-containing protein [Methanophagales archaeon ANME-1-THS]
MTTEQPIFELENVSYKYPTGTEALKNVNMEIYKGARVAILGPAAFLFSPLLEILDGLLSASHGTVKAMGMILNDAMINSKEIYAFRRKVGFVFQDPDIELFSPTVYEDIAFGPLHLGIPEDEIKKRVERALNLLKIEELKNKHPYNLSSGEKRKAAIAAVLSIDPEVLLLDEPTADLDSKSRAELIGIINGLNRKGKTIITATHDVNAVPMLADSVYMLNKRVIAEGTLQKIFSDVELLKENNLEVPEVFKLFEVLRCFGYNCEELPLSIEEAIEHLTRTIETAEGHIHLHIHEHTHDEMRRLKDKYEHH